MMNQPLRRMDPLGRSAPLSTARASSPWASAPTVGSVSPIRGGSERAIVDIWIAEAVGADDVGHRGDCLGAAHHAGGFGETNACAGAGRRALADDGTGGGEANG
jgi:hypothetical protein